MNDLTLYGIAGLTNHLGESLSRLQPGCRRTIDPGIALPAGETITTGVQTYALATASRSLAIGAILLWALTTRRRDATTALLLVTGLFQTGDAAVHLTNANPAAAAAGVLAIIAFVSFRALRVNRDALS
jgi:hypothetical protein